MMMDDTAAPLTSELPRIIESLQLKRENFPTSEEVQRSRSGRAEEKKAASAQSIDEVKRDKYGNEFGSIEYWIAKGNEPKRPKVGDIVVLAGDNAVTESDPSLGEITPEQKAVL